MVNRIFNAREFASSEVAATFREKPLGFVDVGARGGVHPLVEPLAGATAVLAFEPDREECDRLQQEFRKQGPWALFAVEAAALAGAEAMADFHVYASAVNSSLRQLHPGFVQRYAIKGAEQTATVRMLTTTLDKVLFERRPKEDFWGEILKLDAQGSDFEVLRGASRTLDERTVAIYVETQFFQQYREQKLFSEVELLLREHGFSFFGFASIHGRSSKRMDKRTHAWTERVLHANAVFFRDPLAGGLARRPLSRRQLHALFVCAILLGFHDLAMELASTSWGNPAEAAHLQALVKWCASVPPESALGEVEALSANVRRDTALANVHVGRFVDERRHRCGYDDVLRLLGPSTGTSSRQE